MGVKAHIIKHIDRTHIVNPVQGGGRFDPLPSFFTSEKVISGHFYIPSLRIHEISLEIKFGVFLWRKGWGWLGVS